MRIRFKKWLLLTPVVMTALLLVLVWAADSWLESAGGRARVESALQDALGMPVHLQEGFRVSLLPEPGVAGDGLEIGGSGSDGVLLRCDSYHASISLWALLHGELVVKAVRAEDGEIDFNQIPAGDPDTPSRPIWLPRIDLLQLESFRIPMGGDEEMSLEVHRLELGGFQVGTASPLSIDGSLIAHSNLLFRMTAFTTLTLSTEPDQLRVALNSLTLEAFGQDIEGIEGSVNWDLSGQLVEARLEGGSVALGEASLAASFMTEPQSGTMTLSYKPPERTEPANVETAFRRQERGVLLSRISADLADQRITGDGCWVSEPDSELQLDLTSDSIDLDQLQAWMPPSDDKGEPAKELPFGLRVRLSAARVRSGDMTAHQVELAVGEAPDCTGVLD